MKPVPKENLIMINNNWSSICSAAEKDVCAGLQSKSKDLFVRSKWESIRKKAEPQDVFVENSRMCPNDVFNDGNAIKKRCKTEVKAFDLKNEGNSSMNDTRQSFNTGKSERENITQRTRDENSLRLARKCLRAACNQLETRLEKIPKEILGDYGFVIEDWDGSRNGSDGENVGDSKDEDDGVGDGDGDDEDDDEDEEEGRLVIDEGDSPRRNEKTEEAAEKGNENREGANFPNKTDLSSAKENESGINNCGHHLVISSVVSLQWIHQICKICSEYLPDESSFENHKKKHCSFPGCLDYIADDNDREKHLKIHRAHPVKPFRCEYCKKRFHYYRFARRHEDMCKVLKRSKCPCCKYTTSKVGQFNKHVAMHFKKLKCTDCKKNYSMVKKYMEHLYEDHRQEVSFQCTECPQRFELPENIQVHIQTHKLNLADCGLSPFIKVQSVADK